MSDAPSPRQRLAALAALVVITATLVALVILLYEDVAVLSLTVVNLVLAGVAAWFVITRRGVVRVAAAICVVLLLAGPLVALVANDTIGEIALVVALVAVAIVLARYALAVDRSSLRAAVPPGELMPRPQHPVLIMNPRSGGGKAVKFDLANEARARGVEAVMLEPGDDLETLARDAVARGADVLGMAGGDGSQALVASIAMEHDLPFVCIPAGTRNHLALDLGVDRDDVVGSLDAFVEGYERRIDLARVNGRVFVNNVSLGVYAEIVQSDAYRDAKLQTTADMLPALLGPGAEHFSFELDAVGGEPLRDACLVLVSNNVYQLDRLGGFGTRARIDDGVLGVVALRVDGAGAVGQLVAAELAGRVRSYAGWHQWTTPTLEIRSDGDVAAGVDGEALSFPAPLRFEVVPNALRVRVARTAVGLSPAAAARSAQERGLRGLLRVAAGRES
jgi:diacylglycerol kinase family enzyme